MSVMQVAAGRLVLRVPAARSLKDKRRVVHKVRDRVRARFDVAISEVESLDEHRLAVFGVVAVSNDSRVLQALFEKVVTFVQQLYVAEVVDWRVRIEPFKPHGDLNVGDLPGY